MTEPTKVEELFMILTDTLNELAELESAEVIFDHIVDNFAMEAEYYMDQATTFTEMLNTFRHDNPSETIPEAPSAESEDLMDFYASAEERPVNWEAIEANLSPTNRELMSGNADEFLKTLKNIHFPGTIDL